MGDGLCDYTGQSASVGLFEHILGKSLEGGEELLFIEYEIRPIGEQGSDRLVGEYASRLEWLATLDMERMSNGWLIKTIILAVSIAFLVMVGYWGGMGYSFRSLTESRRQIYFKLEVQL